jgi:ribosomal protein S12 methylthiotransferase
MKFSLITLGCDKNTVDSERYLAELVAHGAEQAASPKDAEFILVNTCGFIDAAKKESIDALVEAAQWKRDGACKMVAALGCMVERHRHELEAALPEVDVFLGTSEMDRLIPVLDERGMLADAPLLRHPGVRLYAGELPHVRYLKISEGCDHGCAFCAIPLMRGRHRSFAMRELVREAQLLEMQGAREVNLVAQDLAHYGRDLRNGTGLTDLLAALLSETSIPWFRLLYIYSAGLTPAMLDLIAREPRIVRYLDIPMQHAADTVLARMRRPERKARQREKIEQIRVAVPGIAIRTTVIVGFPGETESEFQELLEFLEEVQLERVGVFTYSPQDGTRASAFPDDVPDVLKRERQERVIELQRDITGDRYGQMLGSVVRAIVDRLPDSRGLAQARTEGQADDIDGVTWLATEATPGTIAQIRLNEIVDDYDFVATLVHESDVVPRARSTARLRRVLPMVGSAGPYGR